MATPDYCFVYPNSSHRFFVIYNTYYDLPETIPMDLATFLAYHFNTGRDLSGLFFCYEDLIRSGCSMFETTLEQFVSIEELAFQYLQIKHCDLLTIAETNKVASQLIHQELLTGKPSPHRLQDIIKQNQVVIRPVNYYYSMNYTIDWEFTHEQVGPFQEDKLNAIKDQYSRYAMENAGNVSSFIEHPFEVYLFFIEHKGMPLHLVPHIFRFNPLYRERCNEGGLNYLLPDFKDWTPDSYSFHLENRISADQFSLKRVEFTADIAIIYFKQAYTMFEDVRQRFDRLGKRMEELTITEIEQLLVDEESYTDYLPEAKFEPSRRTNQGMVRYVYFFEHSVHNEQGSPKLYSDVITISFDQGGLAKMKVFNDSFALCNASGEEILYACQDLEIGINGLILSRCPAAGSIHWEISQYHLQHGMLDVSIDYIHYLFSMDSGDIASDFSIQWRDSALNFMYEDYIEPDELKFHEGTGSVELLHSLIDNESLTFPTASVLYPFYQQDLSLAIKAVRYSHLVYTLFPLNWIFKPELMEVFEQAAPPAFYDIFATQYGFPDKEIE